jgi:hypothetical protein
MFYYKIIKTMWFFIVWLVPIIALFWIKWQQLEHGTIKDLFYKDVNPICKECGECKNELKSMDWLVFIPFVGLIMILWTLFDDKLKKLYWKICDWLNTPIK